VLVAIAGGVGAARMLAALSSVTDPAGLTAVVNTGDDTVLHGLHISPDLDTVVYTLAGQINPETGWGRVGETWGAMADLRAYGGDRLAWFNLGDHDLGTHMYRTSRLAEGATLHEVTGEIARRWGLTLTVLPMSDDRVETRVTVDDGSGPVELGFQEYFVGRRHSVPVLAVTRRVGDGVGAAADGGAASHRGTGDRTVEATAAPGVLEAIGGAEGVVICPSNPILSIGPVLATGGIGGAVAARRDVTVAVSPIIAGRALKGPADTILADLGHEPSVVGVARLWAPYASTLVVDTADADLAGAVEAEGMRCVVAPTIMHGPAEAAALGRTVLDVIAGRGGAGSGSGGPGSGGPATGGPASGGQVTP
jgi:LPPG:FO 2-phospho-L-lactate transferase